MEVALAENGEDTPAKPGSLRWAARQLLIRSGTDTQAMKEVADRLDGKAHQSVDMVADVTNHEAALDQLK